MRSRQLVLALALLPLCGSALAKPVTYVCDPAHTHPSFAADHLGGLSIWRGMFTRTRCTIVMNRQARTGTVHVTVDTASDDFGNKQLDKDARTIPTLLDTARYPTATYVGRLADFVRGSPTRVIGRFTLHGVTRPLTLTIRHFECKEIPMFHQYRCGADAISEFNRAKYGMTFGKAMGFRMWVRLKIQVEAVRGK
jgi:polyisoprenoid-binding protein YceI